MADRLGSLRDKYRAVTHDRLRKICHLLRTVESANDGRIANAMAELHAVKGESSMVGFDAMSQLAHTLESYVADRRSNAETSYGEVADAVDSLVSVFDQSYDSLTRDPAIDELFCELSAALPVPPRGAHDEQKLPIVPEPKHLNTQAEEVNAERPLMQAPQPETRARFTRIDTSRIDGLCDAIAEVTLKLGGLESELTNVAHLMASTDVSRTLAALRQRFASVRNELDDVAASAWALRLVSVTPRLEELASYASTLALSLEKDVDVEVDASGVELERNVLDELGEPLMHIVRNAVDHGIEQRFARGDKPTRARLRCCAESRGASALLAIEDDGIGLDATAIRRRAVALGLLTHDRASFLTDAESLELVFLERFTQRDTANAISGRGVGLSAARRKVEAMGGAIRVESSLGRGTRFEILVPSTMSRERVLLVEVANTRCCIPTRWALAIVTDSAVVAAAKEKHYTSHAGRLIVVRSVAEWMSLQAGKERTLVVVEIAGRDGAFLVDRVLGEQDILRLSADPMLSLNQHIEASGILDDGEIVLFLRWAEALRATAHRRVTEQNAPEPLARTATILVVDDSAVIRDIVSELLIDAGLKVLTAENGLLAAKILESTSCDLVISDVEMPQLSGLELLEHIRKSNDSLPVIMLTTRSSPENRRKAASLGANAYIVKSEFRGSVLLDVVRQFVEIPT